MFNAQALDAAGIFETFIERIALMQIYLYKYILQDSLKCCMVFHWKKYYQAENRKNVIIYSCVYVRACQAAWSNMTKIPQIFLSPQYSQLREDT